MKILLASMSMEIGGAETHILELARELKKHNHDVTVISQGGIYVPILEKNEIRHITAPLTRKDPKSLITSYKVMSELIKNEKFDIVHSHARIPNFIIWMLKKRYNFGFVSTLHFAFTKKKAVEKFTVWGEKCLVVSDDLRRHLIKNSRVKPKDAITTVNGINLEEFSSDIENTKYLYDEFPLKKDSKKIVCVCRLEYGNCDSAYKLLQKAYDINKRIKNVQIMIVGNGACFDELSNKAKQINKKTKTDTVIMTNARSDVSSIVKLADVFVGISRAALEAMAAEKIVVLTGSYGHFGVMYAKDFMNNQQTNFTCRKLDALTDEKMFDSITEAFNIKKEDRERETKEIKELVCKNFSTNRMYEDAMKVYEALLYEKKVSDIVLSGYYGFSNSGDDAILKMIIGDIKSYDSNIGITILSNRPLDAKNIYSVNAVSRWNIFKVKKVLKKAKVFISGGGSIIQDATSTKSLIYYLSLIVMAKKYNNKIMLYANGMGPVNKKYNRKLTKNILNQTDIITLRETDSQDFLNELGVLNPVIKVTCDPVIGITNIPVEETENLLFRYDLFSKKFAVVSLREWKTVPMFEKELVSAINDIKRKHNIEILFLPLQHPNDMEINKKIAKETNSLCIEKRLSAELCIGIAQYSQFVIGMRLHMLIYAFTAQVPSVGISYDPKIESVMRYFGQDTYLGVLEFTKTSFLAKVERIIKNNDIYRTDLKIRLEQLRAKNKVNLDCVIELLEEKKA